jgi:hypothetical protein
MITFFSNLDGIKKKFNHKIQNGKEMQDGDQTKIRQN